jgi:lysophospholipid acyltransferase (LPLAT)-like uncharacterized protein
MTSRILREERTMKAAVLLASWVVRFWFGSVRFRILNREAYQQFIAGTPRKDNAVVATWHRHVIPTYYFFRSVKDLLIMGSRSRDGEFATRLGRRFGLQFTRGSSSLGGHGALEEMIEYLKTGPRGKICSTPVDGPQGPARKLKKGMLVLAKETDAFFIPLACSGKRVITFSRAWDQTILPLPFSEMFIDFHPPFKVPSNLSESELEEWRIKVENILNQLTDRVDRIAGYCG